MHQTTKNIKCVVKQDGNAVRKSQPLQRSVCPRIRSSMRWQGERAQIPPGCAVQYCSRFVYRFFLSL